MALVNYSDSETSDAEETAPAPPTVPKPSIQSSKANIQKSANPSGPRKIKVELPTVQPEPDVKDAEDGEEPPAKRARTAGAFSGFNSLLPAPKRTVAQNAPKAGVSLKTSSEAAFSRNPVPTLEGALEDNTNEETAQGANVLSEKPHVGEEVKVVGKVTKFKPLSVANRKKPVVKKAKVDDERGEGMRTEQPTTVSGPDLIKEVVEPPPLPKPKRSLFSVPQDEVELPSQSTMSTYESITTNSNQPAEDEVESNDISYPYPQTKPTQPPPASLQSLTSDLNLTPAQRRQLFGRNAKDLSSSDINIAHFNMEAEYAANEQLRQAGEVVEHRAVKAIAPGKHSLQQLVNNARSQQDAMEDKWAQGRKERGDGGGRYGWGR